MVQIKQLFQVATALTVYGIETLINAEEVEKDVGCNSTYRLRY